jgi:4-hydroxymandelate oxidase
MTRRDLLLTGVLAITARCARSAEAVDLNHIASVNEFEALARTRLSHMAYDYVAGGVGNEVTLHSNLESWDRIHVRPRILVDVSAIDTRVRLFGQELPHPFLFAPTAYHRLYHPEGELETVRGAAASRTTLVASSFATATIEDMAGAASASLWFQLYVERDHGVTKALVQRAEAAGCRAICVTVDQPARGYRDRDIRNSFALPPGVDRANLRGLGEDVTKKIYADDGIYTPSHDPTFTLRDLEWLRSLARVPLLAKGVLTPEAAEDVIRAGVAGIVVSNHGGRSVDTVPATAEVFPSIVDKVAGRVPLLVDGGIRRGTDMMKALAMGANAVLIGRPYVYALSVAGAKGMRRAADILTTELKMSMAMSGRPNIASLGRDLIWTSPASRM